MKKLISGILALTLLFSSFCISAAASGTTGADEQRKTAEYNLERLCEYVGLEVNSVGEKKISYEWYTEQELNAAEAVLNNSNATTGDLIDAWQRLIDAAYSEDVDKEIATLTYENALKEQNYNNWYGDEEWSDFIAKRDELGTALEMDSDIRITKTFYALLKTYNTMTNRYKVFGDVNGDGSVDVNDVTLVQKYIAGEAQLTGAQKQLVACDYFYEKTSVDSATNIQKGIVGMSTNYTDSFVPEYGPYDSYDRRIERTLNFTLCPREFFGFGFLKNGVYDTQYLDIYFKLCYKEI